MGQIQKIAEFVRPTGLGSFNFVSYMTNGQFAFAATRGLPARADDQPVLVRIQSPCLFGESFGIKSCDCAAQLHKALELGSQSPPFILIYLMEQEGRGLGLFQKIRAIEVEANDGVDMIEAFEKLHLPLDLRDYAVAADILKDLIPGRSIRLLTNNPKKIDGLRELEIDVASREPLLIDIPNEACRRYLSSKKRGMGHLLTNVD